uniref:Uncharacterized protein n=1 Tax=Arundo donax TaxID=35708 RepID=A0A0A8YCS7_ARUDO
MLFNVAFYCSCRSQLLCHFTRGTLGRLHVMHLLVTILK